VLASIRDQYDEAMKAACNRRCCGPGSAPRQRSHIAQHQRSHVLAVAAWALSAACVTAPGPTPTPARPAAEAGSSAAASPSAAPRRAEALYVPPSDYDFSRNPALLARVTGSAHGYFRFVNSAFGRAVCSRFAPTVDSMPLVNLHGDAHVEQYAVTSSGRGLTDYEDATSGPAVVDLARFGVSLRLACEQRGWSGCAQPSLDEFLRGYRAALYNPGLRAPEPSLVGRLRAASKRTHHDLLIWADSLMVPMATGRAELETDFGRYVEQARSTQPDLPPDFFRIKRVGAHHLGVGSALQEKYLFRVEGPTEAAADDVILELKEVRALGGVGCVTADSSADPTRIALGRARIADLPFRYFGYVKRHGRMFWVHEWVEHYQEFDIAKTPSSPRDLQEVAYDVGVQLGRGHPNQLDSGANQDIRRRELAVLDTIEPELRRAVEELAADTTRSWQRFRAAVGDSAATPAGP